MSVRRWAGWLVVGLLPAVAACGGGGVEPNGLQEQVDALDNTFGPEVVRVEAGTEVVWENRGRNDHNVIPEAEDAEWAVEVDDFKPGDSASHVFTEPGRYRYFCSIHGTVDAGMIGQVVVE